MKAKIIFTVLISIVFLSCRTSQPPAESLTDQPFDLTVQYWFANPNSDSNFTERGIDITIHVQNNDFSLNPEYVIFNERKSFPLMITPADEDGYQIEAHIILESSRYQNSSERVNLSNRVVFTNNDGDEVYFVFREWETLPNRYD